MDFEKLIQRIKRCHWYSGQIEIIKEIPPKEAKRGDLDNPLTEPLAGWLKKQGIVLYSHQTEAIDLIKKGTNVVTI